MIEALVICKHPIRLADLNLTLRAGQEVWLKDDVARKSKDLTHAAKIGAVRVYRKERFRMVKPLPPHAALSRKGRHDRPPRKAHEYVTPVKPSREEALVRPAEVVVNVDTSNIAAQVRDAISEGLSSIPELVRAEIERQSPATNVPSSMVQEISKAMAEVLAKMPVMAAQPRAAGLPAPTDEPLYMPGNLVDKEAKGNIKTKSGSAESNIDEATQALRKLRKKRT